MAEWKKVLVSGSSIEIRDITGSLGLRPSQSVVISASAAISAPTAVNQVATQSGTSKTGNRYALLTSQSAYFYNHNAGYPSSNAWGSNLQGSYFNNFDANSDVSEILRFIAGLLSQSAPDAASNTRTFARLNPQFVNTAGGVAPTFINGRIPSQSTNSDILYLQSKGFANTGSASFTGFGQIYSDSGFSISYSSSVGGSTTVSSSNDTQLFGLGSRTDIVYITASTTFNFYSSSNETVTTNTSSSISTITLSNENDSLGGAIRRTIATANPAVIPAACQDGKFTGSFASAYNPVTFNSATSGSTGWYHFTQSITLHTGSVGVGTSYTTSSRVFRSAYTDTQFPANVITHTHVTSSLTTVSRSLSGAPYLSQSTYLYICTSSGIFNPLYSTTDSNLFRVTTGSNFLSRSLGEVILNMATLGTINTNNLVYSSSGNTTAKSAGAYPSQNDVIKVSASFALNPTAGTTGIAQTGFTVANTGSSISASALSRNGSATHTGSGIFLNYFTPGTFGQPLASGTMAIYNRPQGYDGGTLAGGAENFSGETFRLQIDNNALSGSYDRGTKFTTASYLDYNLGSLDLQVKPGFLVRPGGTYGYWVTNPNSGKTYKYYIRAFKRDLDTSANSLRIDVGQKLTSWQSTNTLSASVALIFSASGAPAFSPPRIFDVTELNSNAISSSMPNDDFKNPFTTNIDLWGNNTGDNNTGTSYYVPMAPLDGKKLDGTHRDFLVVVRYTGDTPPISSISITYT